MHISSRLHRQGSWLSVTCGNFPSDSLWTLMAGIRPFVLFRMWFKYVSCYFLVQDFAHAWHPGMPNTSIDSWWIYPGQVNARMPFQFSLCARETFLCLYYCTIMRFPTLVWKQVISHELAGTFRMAISRVLGWARWKYGIMESQATGKIDWSYRYNGIVESLVITKNHLPTTSLQGKHWLIQP